MSSDDIVLHMDYSVDLGPKVIWGGLTIPGKKMMKVLMPEGPAVERANNLLGFYKDKADTTLIVVAEALHHTTERGMAGPAFRDIGKGIQFETMYNTMYGAILTDIRDFLKLRFRANGMSAAQVSDKAMLSQALERGDIGYLINYLIGALDTLSRQKIDSRDGLEKSVYAIRDVATTTSKLACPEGPEHWERTLGRPEDMWQKPKSDEPRVSQPPVEATWEQTQTGTSTGETAATYCTKCGRKNDSRASYCQDCGTPIAKVS